MLVSFGEIQRNVYEKRNVARYMLHTQMLSNIYGTIKLLGKVKFQLNFHFIQFMLQNMLQKQKLNNIYDKSKFFDKVKYQLKVCFMYFYIHVAI